MKLRVSELLRRACIYAEADRRHFADCNAIGSPERAEAEAEAKQLHDYRVKRWGITRHESMEQGCDVIDARTGAVVRRAANTSKQGGAR